MDFSLSPRAQDLLERVRTFVREEVYPAEAVYRAQREDLRRAGRPNDPPQILLELIAEAKSIVPKTEATVRQLGRDVAAPLVHVEARAKQADQTVVQSFAPLRARALQLKPPAG